MDQCHKQTVCCEPELPFVRLCAVLSSFLNSKEFLNIKSVRFNREFDSSHNFANSNIFQTRFSHFVLEKENSEFEGK